MPALNFGQTKDTSKNIIKVIGAGGGGCNWYRRLKVIALPRELVVQMIPASVR